VKQKKLLVNITIIRGLLALTLGVLLLLQPATLRPFVINFMGVYWLLGGFVSLRIAKESPRPRRLRLAVGIMEIVAGAALLTRTISVSLIPLPILMFVLGLLILFSGLLHILAGIRFSEKIGRGWEITNVLLGVFEVGFGVMVTLYPWFRFELIYLSVAMWAFLGGIIMIGDGIRLRQILREQPAGDSS
jgi:uncharacterized membrane protein HdeD (DUF308 family)